MPSSSEILGKTLNFPDPGVICYHPNSCICTGLGFLGMNYWCAITVSTPEGDPS